MCLGFVVLGNVEESARASANAEPLSDRCIQRATVFTERNRAQYWQVISTVFVTKTFACRVLAMVLLPLVAGKTAISNNTFFCAVGQVEGSSNQVSLKKA